MIVISQIVNVSIDIVEAWIHKIDKMNKTYKSGHN